MQINIREIVAAFKPSNMLDRQYYLRPERIIVFQILTAVSTATGAVSGMLSGLVKAFASLTIVYSLLFEPVRPKECSRCTEG